MGAPSSAIPRASLMDEPLSDLDGKLRVEMRAEIARLQRELPVTTVYVTLLAEVAGHLAGAVAPPAQTVDPETVVLGGGVAGAGPGLLTAVQRALRDRAARSPVVAAVHLADRVALVPRGVPAGAVGAAVLARRHVTTADHPADTQVMAPCAVASDTS